MKTLILAGGFGTRLKSITGEDTPKSMVSVLGKPFLEYQIRILKEQDLTDIILGLHYKREKIKSYFGSGLRWGVNLTYSEEDLPLGTGGAVKNAEEYLREEDFFVLNVLKKCEADLL